MHTDPSVDTDSKESDVSEGRINSAGWGRTFLCCGGHKKLTGPGCHGCYLHHGYVCTLWTAMMCLAHAPTSSKIPGLFGQILRLGVT